MAAPWCAGRGLDSGGVGLVGMGRGLFRPPKPGQAAIYRAQLRLKVRALRIIPIYPNLSQLIPIA